MADTTSQLTNMAQEATRTMFDAMQGIASMQANTLQRLSEIQQSLLKQGSEAANEQLQLLSRVREPREFASAQADLIKRHGQLYMDQVKETVDVIAQGWEEYGEQLKKGKNAKYEVEEATHAAARESEDTTKKVAASSTKKAPSATRESEDAVQRATKQAADSSTKNTPSSGKSS